MSSMRNAVQRRPHRERAQPLERRRLGLLEKHKDYSLRAKDYNKKKAQLKALRDKAAERNDDEFYFGMMSRKGPGSRIKDGRRWVGTVEGDRGNKALDVDAVRLLKTQDLGYLRTMRQVAVKELARLEERAVIARGLNEDEEMGGSEEEDDDEDEDMDADLDVEKGRGLKRKRGERGARKIVFLEDEKEREGVIRGLVEDETGKSGDGDGDGEEGEDKVRVRKRLQMELEHARKKVKVLAGAEDALLVQQAKMAKTATSGGQTRRGKKIMVRRRKR